MAVVADFGVAAGSAAAASGACALSSGATLAGATPALSLEDESAYTELTLTSKAVSSMKRFFWQFIEWTPKAGQ